MPVGRKAWAGGWYLHPACTPLRDRGFRGRASGVRWENQRVSAVRYDRAFIDTVPKHPRWIWGQYMQVARARDSLLPHLFANAHGISTQWHSAVQFYTPTPIRGISTAYTNGFLYDTLYIKVRVWFRSSPRWALEAPGQHTKRGVEGQSHISTGIRPECVDRHYKPKIRQGRETVDSMVWQIPGVFAMFSRPVLRGPVF